MNWDFVLKKEGELALQKIQEKPKKKEFRLWLFFTRLLPLYRCKRNNNDNRKRETVSKSSLSIHPCSLSVCRWNELLCSNTSGSSNSSAYRHIRSFIQVHNRHILIFFVFALATFSSNKEDISSLLFGSRWTRRRRKFFHFRNWWGFVLVMQGLLQQQRSSTWASAKKKFFRWSFFVFFFFLYSSWCQ